MSQWKKNRNLALTLLLIISTPAVPAHAQSSEEEVATLYINPNANETSWNLSTSDILSGSTALTSAGAASAFHVTVKGAINELKDVDNQLKQSHEALTEAEQRIKETYQTEVSQGELTEDDIKTRNKQKIILEEKNKLVISDEYTPRPKSEIIGKLKTQVDATIPPNPEIAGPRKMTAFVIQGYYPDGPKGLLTPMGYEITGTPEHIFNELKKKDFSKIQKIQARWPSAKPMSTHHRQVFSYALADREKVAQTREDAFKRQAQHQRRLKVLKRLRNSGVAGVVLAIGVGTYLHHQTEEVLESTDSLSSICMDTELASIKALAAAKETEILANDKDVIDFNAIYGEHDAQLDDLCSEVNSVGIEEI